MAELEAVKDRMVAEVDRLADVLLEASHPIHEHPELAFEEHHAHDLLTDILEGEGLAVERSAYGLDDRVRGPGRVVAGPTIAVLCEYDALPGIGHACGHNIIATAGLGAGLAAAALAEEARRPGADPRHAGRGGRRRQGLHGRAGRPRRRRRGDDGPPGRRRPAEHERHRDPAVPRDATTGKAAHAAAAPHKGRNALDAAVLGYMNVAALRQHIRPDERIHGIFTEAGDAANIVPGHGRGRLVRAVAARCASLEALKAPGARLPRGRRRRPPAARWTYEWKDPAYADMVDNEPFVDLYVENAARLGRDGARPPERSPASSAAPTWAT